MNSTYAGKTNLEPEQTKAAPDEPASRSSQPATPVVQRKESVPRVTSVFQPNSNPTGLPDGLKAGVEQLSGLSMDDVRVHYRSTKPDAVNALAYTKGNEIHLGPGQEQHLPHEAWHAVQQRQGRVKPTVQFKGQHLNTDAALEREADVIGAKAMQVQRCASVQPHGPARAAGVGEARPLPGPGIIQRKIYRSDSYHYSKVLTPRAARDNLLILGIDSDIVDRLIKRYKKPDKKYAISMGELIEKAKRKQTSRNRQTTPPISAQPAQVAPQPAPPQQASVSPIDEDEKYSGSATQAPQSGHLSPPTAVKNSLLGDLANAIFDEKEEKSTYSDQTQQENKSPPPRFAHLKRGTTHLGRSGGIGGKGQIVLDSDEKLGTIESMALFTAIFGEIKKQVEKVENEILNLESKQDDQLGGASEQKLTKLREEQSLLNKSKQELNEVINENTDRVGLRSAFQSTAEKNKLKKPSWSDVLSTAKSIQSEETGRVEKLLSSKLTNNQQANRIRELASVYTAHRRNYHRIEKFVTNFRELTTKNRVKERGSEPKKSKRAVEKGILKYGEDYSRLTDLTAFSIPYSSLQEMGLALKKLRTALKHNGYVIKGIKNRFNPLVGYSDILINVQDKENGYIWELQIHLAELLNLKKQAHGIYNDYRSLKEWLAFVEQELGKQSEKTNSTWIQALRDQFFMTKGKNASAKLTDKDALEAKSGLVNDIIKAKQVIKVADIEMNNIYTETNKELDANQSQGLTEVQKFTKNKGKHSIEQPALVMGIATNETPRFGTVEMIRIDYQALVKKYKFKTAFEKAHKLRELTKALEDNVHKYQQKHSSDEK